MVYNQTTRVEILSLDGSCLEEVKDFKYLGAWVQSIEQDIKLVQLIKLNSYYI